MNNLILIFFVTFIMLFFIAYALIQYNRKSNNKKIENNVRAYIVKKYENLNGQMILYPFVNSELNQRIFPEKYNFIFCSFGLIILSKHYEPIIILCSQKAYYIENITINKCNLLKYEINSKRVELHLLGIGHITKIKIIVKLYSKEMGEEIYKLINDLKLII